MKLKIGRKLKGSSGAHVANEVDRGPSWAGVRAVVDRDGGVVRV